MLAQLLTRLGHYTSTYCLHGDHAHCRKTCKHCKKPCRCFCHTLAQELGEKGNPVVLQFGPVESVLP